MIQLGVLFEELADRGGSSNDLPQTDQVHEFLSFIETVATLDD